MSPYPSEVHAKAAVTDAVLVHWYETAMENHALFTQISSLPLVSFSLLFGPLGSTLRSPVVQFVYTSV